MKKKSLSRHTDLSLNLTPHYKANLFDGGGAFDNLTTASLWDNSTKSALSGGESVGGTFASIEGMLDAGLSNAKLKSTYNIQAGIADNMGLAMGNQNLNTNDELMSAWDQYNPMSHVHRKDIRGGSTFGRIWNTNMASIKGAEAGWNATGSPYGAIAGGVIGLGAGIAGWITGGRKASKIRDKLNREIDIANEMGYQTLANETSDVAQKNLWRAEGNYVAEGGELNTGLDKKFAGTMMQDIYGNGIPSNKYPGGGNVNITVSNTPAYTSNVAALIPFIQKAKAMREAKELEAQQATQIRKEAQVPQQIPAKYTYTPPTEETKTQLRGYVPSDELIDSILRHEGYLPKPSNKLDGIWTIGYGDTDKALTDYYRAHPNEIFPEEEARKRAADRIRTEFLGYAEKYTPNWDKLTGPQKDAIISYIYNVGPGSFKNKHPKLQKALREMNLEAIAENMSAGYYDKSKPGLKKRRDFERLAFYYPEMTTYGVIPEGVTKRSFDANKLRYDALGVKQPKTGNVPAIYTKEYLDTMPAEKSVMQRAADIWGFAEGGNLFAYGDPPEKENIGGYKNDPIELSLRRYSAATHDPVGGFDLFNALNSWFGKGNTRKGEENEFFRAYLGLENNVPKMSADAKTEWDDAVEKKKIDAGKLSSDFYNTTPRMNQMIEVLADTLNTGDIVRNYRKYKQQNPDIAPKEVFKLLYRQGKEVLNNPNKWIQVGEEVEDYRTGRGTQLRVVDKKDPNTNESMPLGMFGKFGMKWNPEESAIYVHDTYDFPYHITAFSSIPVRPKEMKIRGRIPYKPEEGSSLLRNNGILTVSLKDLEKPIADKEINKRRK